MTGKMIMLKTAIRPLLFLFSFLIPFLGGPGLDIAKAEAASSAVVLMYHRFGETKYPSTNTRLEQLDAHIAELTSGPYTVLPLAEIVTRLKAGQSLPDRTIGLSIDDAYLSVYTQAWPRFKKANLPFTVFISTAHVDHGSNGHLNWDQIREMKEAGVDFGHHTVSHLHMPEASVEDVKEEISLATKRFEAELGFKPKLFAYPYGETRLETKQLVKDAGFEAAFGQHSGVIDAVGDFFYLPRFGLNETFGGEDRVRLIVNALSLPTSDFTPEDPLIGAQNPPAIGFTLKGDVKALQPKLDQLSCFLSHEGQRADVAVLGPRIEIRPRQPLPVGRTRLNCTLPGPEGRWHWFGHQFIRLK